MMGLTPGSKEILHNIKIAMENALFSLKGGCRQSELFFCKQCTVIYVSNEAFMYIHMVKHSVHDFKKEN